MGRSFWLLKVCFVLLIKYIINIYKLILNFGTMRMLDSQVPSAGKNHNRKQFNDLTSNKAWMRTYGLG